MNLKKLNIKSILSLVLCFLFKYVSYIILITCIIISFFIWKHSSDPATISSFGLNCFTDLLGMLITIAIFQNIIKQQNNKKMLPVRVAQYKDIQVFLSTIVSFWCMVYNYATNGSSPKNIDDLFSAESFKKMLNYLNMSGQPPVLGMNTWWDWFNNQGHEIIEYGEKILNRYNSNLDPQIFGYIHYSIDVGHLIRFMNKVLIIRNLDLSRNIPRPYYLSAYYVEPTQKEFDVILDLFKWCEDTYKDLNKKINGIKLYKVSLAKYSKPNNMSSMLTDNQIEEQTKLFRKWQTRDSKLN